MDVHTRKMEDDIPKRMHEPDHCSTKAGMEGWWRHEAKALGYMLASGHATQGKLRNYHAGLMRLYKKAKHLHDKHYKDEDTLMELRTLLNEVKTLANFVRDVIIHALPALDRSDLK